MVCIVVISVADVSHEFLALVRTATSELPYVREKAPFDIADPVHISQFDGMLGPWDSREAVPWPTGHLGRSTATGAQHDEGVDSQNRSTAEPRCQARYPPRLVV